jgi:hypothetical protein
LIPRGEYILKCEVMGVERMSEITPTKRRRGAQPGNHNSKGNRGNPRPRRNLGNRGGKGAPTGNANARKRPRGLDALLLEYRDDIVAREWIEANREALACLSECESRTDAVDVAMHHGLTPDFIAARGREFKLGLFSKPEEESRESYAA